jgi:hypothetical protein
MIEMTLDELMEHFTEMENDHALTADGYDAAIIGAGDISGLPVVIYDYEKVIEILMSWDMTRDDAVEFYEYNIAGSCGRGMPVFQDIKVIPG